MFAFPKISSVKSDALAGTEASDAHKIIIAIPKAFIFILPPSYFFLYKCLLVINILTLNKHK